MADYCPGLGRRYPTREAANDEHLDARIRASSNGTTAAAKVAAPHAGHWHLVSPDRATSQARRAQARQQGER